MLTVALICALLAALTLAVGAKAYEYDYYHWYYPEFPVAAETLAEDDTQELFYYHDYAPPTSHPQGSVVATARAYFGAPYVYGALDCSGFTQAVYAAYGVSLPDNPNDQIALGVPSAGNAGDLLFFSEDGSGFITHVGIATGAGTIVHSSSYEGMVTETDLDYLTGFVGARKIL